MSELDGNTSTQSNASPVPPGPTVAELQAKLDEAQRQSEGRLRDLQQERAKRQELETHISSASSAAKPDVTHDELGQVINPYTAPIAAKADAALKELEQLRLEKTQAYLANKTGKTWDQIEADKSFQDKLNSVIRKYGVSGNVYDMTVRAYELMQLEDLRAKEEERQRAETAGTVASLPTGTGVIAPSTSSKKYSADEFNAMSPREFGNLSKSGDFRKLPDGTFEYKSR